MAKSVPSKNADILRENRQLIIQRLIQKKTIREIADEIGVSYEPLYDYLTTGRILRDNG
jgi:hypothetical protein